MDVVFKLLRRWYGTEDLTRGYHLLLRKLSEIKSSLLIAILKREGKAKARGSSKNQDSFQNWCPFHRQSWKWCIANRGSGARVKKLSYFGYACSEVRDVPSSGESPEFKFLRFWYLTINGSKGCASYWPSATTTDRVLFHILQIKRP